MTPKYFIFIAICFFSSLSYTQPLGTSMSILTNKPFYTININAFGTSYIVRMNGVSIHREYGDGQLTTSLPINHWMHPSTNNLELILLPAARGESLNLKAHVKIELLVAANNNLENKIKIADISFEGKNIDIDLSKGPPVSDSDYYKFMDTLLVEYMKIQYAIKTNSIEQVATLFTERNNELDAAFYLKKGTTREKILTSLKSAAMDSELELQELKSDYLDFTVEDNNKLISLTRNGNKSAIVLNFKNGGGSQRYSLSFRYKEKKWILTR